MSKTSGGGSRSGGGSGGAKSIPGVVKQSAFNISGYTLDSAVSKLRIRGMYTQADKLLKTHSINGLSKEAARIVKEELR